MQHLTNEFWVRWKKEFLLSLQERQKWTKPRKNLQVNDVVIVKEDDVPRNQWRVCRVIEALLDENGLVRKVKLEVGNRNLASKGKRSRPLSTLERPIHKLVLLMSAEDEKRQGNPHRGAIAKEIQEDLALMDLGLLNPQ